MKFLKEHIVFIMIMVSLILFAIFAVISIMQAEIELNQYKIDYNNYFKTTNSRKKKKIEKYYDCPRIGVSCREGFKPCNKNKDGYCVGCCNEYSYE